MHFTLRVAAPHPKICNSERLKTGVLASVTVGFKDLCVGGKTADIAAVFFAADADADAEAAVVTDARAPNIFVNFL